MKPYSNSYFANIDYVISYMYRERAVLLCCKYVMFCNMLSSYVFLMMSNCRRAKLGQIQGGCRGPSKIRQRGGCNNFLPFTR